MAHFTLPFTRKNALFLALCLGGLMLIFAVSIIPLIIESKELEKDIPKVEQKTREQKQVQELIKILEKKTAVLAAQEDLPAVHETALSLARSSAIRNEITILAEENNMHLTRIDPIIPANSENLKQLRFETDLSGKLPYIRPFLFSILRLPYLKDIDSLRMNSNDGFLDLNVVFSVRIQ